MKKILVLSPHMDDAVLSCCDYLLSKKKSRYKIKIITIFTSFDTKNISIDAKYYLEESGYKSIKKFENQRKNEDKNSLNFLEFDYEHLDFIDGGFRKINKKNIYQNYQQLFSGKVSFKDKELIVRIYKKLKKYDGVFDEVLIPLGIGDHADHLITRVCSEKSFMNSKIKYYVDWPYAFKYKNWSLKNLLKIVKNNKWIFLTSKKKKKALQFYQSQVKLLFGKKPIFYPEIVIGFED